MSDRELAGYRDNATKSPKRTPRVDTDRTAGSGCHYWRPRFASATSHSVGSRNVAANELLEPTATTWDCPASYEISYKQFPMASTGPGRQIGSGCSSGFYSWQSALLPHLDQIAVYQAIDFRVNMADLVRVQCARRRRIGQNHLNSRAATCGIPVLICPSDPSTRKSNIMGDSLPAVCSYTAIWVGLLIALG